MSIPQPPPEELFKWHGSWPRWHGSPEDVARVAKKIEDEVRRSFFDAAIFVHLSWGTGLRATGSHDVDAYAGDLRANRRHLTSARVQVVALAKGTPFPLTMEEWPTKTFERPKAWSTESVSPPVLVLLELTAWEGAALTVLAKSGLHGESLFDGIKPYVASGAGKVPRTILYRKPVEWLLPRFEVTDGGRRWLRLVRASGAALGVVGTVAGIAALIIA